MTLPTFEAVRRNAHRMLGDVQDELRSEVVDLPLTTAQAKAFADVRRHIAHAKAALDKAART